VASTWRAIADLLIADLRRIFGDRLASVIAYGAAIEDNTEAPLTCLALVRDCGIADLDACAARASSWKHQGLAIPLILPEDEFRNSLDAFPLEYAEIARAHMRLLGRNPFDERGISVDDIRRACETQIKSHLVHLREGYIESGGHPREVASLVSASAPAFAALLRNVAQLSNVDTGNRSEAARAGARAAGLSDPVIGDVLALEHPAAIPTGDPARLFPAYLGAVEQLARAIDRWRTS
jgi:hypothetical protein